MYPTGTELPQQLAMMGRDLTFGLAKTVLGVNGVHVAHGLIATDLGDDRCSADGRYRGVAANYGRTLDLP